MKYFVKKDGDKETITSTARKYGELTVDLDQVAGVAYSSSEQKIEIILHNAAIMSLAGDGAAVTYEAITRDLLELGPEP